MEEIYEALRAAWCEYSDQDDAIDAWGEIIRNGDNEIFALLREFVMTFNANIESRNNYDFWLCVGYSSSDLAEKFDALKIQFRGDSEAANLTTRVLIACGLVSAKANSVQTGSKPHVSDDDLHFLDFYCGDAPKYVLRPNWALPKEMHSNAPSDGGSAPRF